MTRFRQDFELDTNCKTVNTALSRFAKKFPKAWEVWGESLEYMAENGIEHIQETNDDFCGWSLWVYQDEQFSTHYIAIVLTDKAQEL